MYVLGFMILPRMRKPVACVHRPICLESSAGHRSMYWRISSDQTVRIHDNMHAASIHQMMVVKNLINIHQRKSHTNEAECRYTFKIVHAQEIGLLGYV